MSYKYPALYCGFLALNVLIAFWRIRTSIPAKPLRSRGRVQSYDWYNPAYQGDTYPMHLPIPYSEPVAATLHETTRFSLNVSDETGDLDWETIIHWADGFGRPRIGPDRQIFVVSYFHQLHCLRGIQRGITAPERTDGISPAYGHIQHCINYIRQNLLCMAGRSLEKGDFMASSFAAGTVVDDLVCQDWEVLIRAVQDNYDEWTVWDTQWN